jgi:hypothetical protein
VGVVTLSGSRIVGCRRRILLKWWTMDGVGREVEILLVEQHGVRRS